MTLDTWHLTPDTWHLTPDTGRLTPNMWQMVGGEHSLHISAPQLLRFGIDSVLKILNERISLWMNKLINYEGVYRTAPATAGLLKVVRKFRRKEFITLTENDMPWSEAKSYIMQGTPRNGVLGQSWNHPLVFLSLIVICHLPGSFHPEKVLILGLL